MQKIMTKNKLIPGELVKYNDFTSIVAYSDNDEVIIVPVPRESNYKHRSDLCVKPEERNVFLHKNDLIRCIPLTVQSKYCTKMYEQVEHSLLMRVRKMLIAEKNKQSDEKRFKYSYCRTVSWG